MKLQISTATRPLTFVTVGLAELGQIEISASVNSTELVHGCIGFLKYVAKYVQTANRLINQNESMAYGYWLTKFHLQDSVLVAFEHNDDASSFVEGVSRAVLAWESQHAVCLRAGATFDPPRPDKKVAISAGVLEGEPVEAVRYSSPDHMSGWWITTDRFDGDVSNLSVVPMIDVTKARKDILPLIALPVGYRFRLDPYDVWFDSEQ